MGYLQQLQVKQQSMYFCGNIQIPSVGSIVSSPAKNGSRQIGESGQQS
jgi:hypothetical protein